MYNILNPGKFAVNVTKNRNCALYLNGTVDYETEETYVIEVQIMSLQGFINKEFSITQVTINIIDVNDNKPYFIYPSSLITQEKYYATIPRNAPLASAVLQIKADDKDSGKFGKLQYTLMNNSSDYFAIDTKSGLIRTKRTFDDEIDGDTQLLPPFRLVVKMRDNPNATTDFNEITTTVIVNLISTENRVILVVGDAKPDVVQKKLDTITNVIQEQSGLIVGIEKLTIREFIGGNGTIETDPTGTDVWFYLIDPTDDSILSRNSSLVKRTIFDKSAMDNITFDISGQIMNTAFNIHEPIVLHKVKSASIASFNGEVFPYALIIIACIIFVLGIVGIIYICMSWSRYFDALLLFIASIHCRCLFLDINLTKIKCNGNMLFLLVQPDTIQFMLSRI